MASGLGHSVIVVLTDEEYARYKASGCTHKGLYILGVETAEEVMRAEEKAKAVVG